MDHHSPLVNNCVGLENNRYFLLFMFYMTLGLGYMLITITSMQKHYLFKKHKLLMNSVALIDFLLFLSIGFYSLLSWFTAFFGSTTIEFWRGDGLGKDRREATLRFPTVSDNLYRIFGTYKFFRILSPSFRNVPFTGLEWSFKYKDEGYDCEGLLVKAFDEEKEAVS